MTVNDSPRSSAPSVLINASEIAEIAGVGPSAVSNWKRRHSDFPAEVEPGLFDRAEVIAWLEDTGKDVNLEPESIDSVIWGLADVVRGVLRVDEMPEVMLQLFALRAAESGSYERLLPLANTWEQLENELREDLSAVYRSIIGAIGDSDPDLARALRFSSTVNRMSSLDWRRLVDAVAQLDPLQTDWARASSALVTGFVERHGAKGGEHSSGSALVDVMMALLDPIEGSVYDPACGAAAFLASAWTKTPKTITRLYGQEINEQSWRIGFLHLLLQNASFELLTGDTLVDDRLWQLRADRIALEPPLGLHLRFAEQMDNDPRWSFGLPPKSSADLAWVQHVAFHLADEGLGVVAVAPGCLFRGGTEASIREGLIRADLVDAVVHLPPGMLGATSIPISIIVLHKNRPNRTGRVLFVDARQLGTPSRGGLRQFSPADVSDIAEVLHQWRGGRLEPESQFTGIATHEQIIANGSELIPNRYISYAEAATEIEGEPIAARYERLAKKAAERLAMLPQLEEDVRQQLTLIEVTDA